MDGYNEVDKLKKSIELHKRKLAGSPTAEEADDEQQPDAAAIVPMEE